MALLALAALPVPAAAATEAPRTLCTIRDPRITESSGLAAAGGELYTVNDGGSRLRVFVLDRACRVTRTVDNPLDPYDVEDLARAADGSFWLADTGDNGLDRATVALERLRPDGTATLFRLAYPDGPHDAEAILLDRTGRPYVVTKEPLGSTVYTPAGTLSAGRTTTLREVARIGLGPTGTAGGPVGTASQLLVTGGSVSADGHLLVLRTYTDAYVWSAPDGDLEAALKEGDRRRIPLPATAQGEGIAFSPDGRSLLTSTEGVPGAVHEVPLGDVARRTGTPSGTASPAPEGVAGTDSRPAGRLLLPIAAFAGVGVLLAWLVRRSRRARPVHRR